MPKITKFDRSILSVLREAVAKALAQVEAEFGVSSKFCSGSYTGDNYKVGIEFSVIDGSGAAVTREASAFREVAGLFGLTSDHLFREFTHQGQRWKLVGYNGRKARCPFLILAMDGAKAGKEFYGTEKMVLDGFGVKRALA